MDPSSPSAVAKGRRSTTLSILGKVNAPPVALGSHSRPEDAQDISLTTGKVVPQRRRLWCVLGLVVALCTVIIAVVVGVLVAKNKAKEANNSASLIPWVDLVDAPLKFLVVGDWGRDGAYNQSMNAQAMGMVANSFAPQFIISTGDNFYEVGLHNISDPKFTTSFTSVYSARSLQVQWFAVLGNRDYHVSADFEVDPALSARDRRWFCQANFRRTFNACHVEQQGSTCEHTVELFFIDTSVFIDQYWDENSTEPLNFANYNTDKNSTISFVLNNMKAGLASSDATWKIVIGHHPVYSTGEHGDTPALKHYLEPVLEEFDVDLYMNGHDHTLELIESNGKATYYVTCGAGSQTRATRSQSPNGTSLFFYSLQGFVAVSVLDTTMDLSFYSASAARLFNVTLSKQ